MAAPAPAPAGRRALRLGSVLGVPVELSPSWFLLAALVVFSYGPALDRGGTPLRGYLAAAAFALLLLASVLLHEVGHCVAARLLHLRVRRISVSFLAGLTEITDPAPTPGRAFAVSASGPLVSLLLTGGGLLAMTGLTPGSTGRAVVGLVALTNAGLTVFNLLPGLPLDGGAVLRAVVWRVTGDASTGTLVSAQVGRALAAVVVPLSVLVVAPLYGLRLSTVGVVLTAFVALFLWAGATAALTQVRAERGLRGLSAGQLARPSLHVDAALPLAEALRRAHAGQLQAMVVVSADGCPVAVVSEAAVAAVPEHRRPWVSVGELSRPLAEDLLLDPELSGPALLDALRRAPAAEHVLRGADARVLVATDLDRAAAARAGAGRPASRAVA